MSWSTDRGRDGDLGQRAAQHVQCERFFGGRR